MTEPFAKIEYDFEQEDYLEAQLSLWPPLAPWYRHPNFLLVVFCFFVFVPAFLYLRPALPVEGTSLVLGVCALAAISLPFVWKLEQQRWQRLRTELLRQRYLSWGCSKKGYVAELSEDGFKVSCECGTDTRFWRAMRKGLETPQVFLVVGSNGQFYVFPKRAFASEQLAKFRSLLGNKLPTK